MDKLVEALGPAFAAGFAIQRLLEIFDAILLERFISKEWKKLVLALISLAIGFFLAYGVGLRVLLPLGLPNVGYWLDTIITALIISAGTEGFNSILKFLGYAKENKKNVAQVTEKAAAEASDTEALRVTLNSLR